MQVMPATGIAAWLAAGVPAPMPLSLDGECGRPAGSGRGYLLGLGSNVQPGRMLAAALAMLARRHGPLVVSRVYETVAAGPQQGGGSFYNLAVYLRSGLSAGALKARLNRLETHFGRDRGNPQRRKAPVPLDADILAGPLDAADELPANAAQVAGDAFLLRPVHEVLTALSLESGVPPAMPGRAVELEVAGWRIGTRPVLLTARERLVRGQERVAVH